MAEIRRGKEVRLRKNARPFNLLRSLALGSGMLVVSLISPAAGAKLIQAGIGNYFRKKNFQRHHFLRDLKSLQERNLVDWRETPEGKVRIVITRQGREIILQYKVDEIKLQIPKRWDGKWRLVMFDVPHESKAARDALRRKLLDLKFYPLQKSVFITPYPCEDEIEFISAVFNVRPHVLILYVSRFEGEEKLKYHFGI